MRLVTLKLRREFLAVRGGRKWSAPAFLIEAKARAAETRGAPGPRFGLTVTRKLGSAVVRNRIKRRLREALRQAVPGRALDGVDYVVVARPPAATQPFAGLVGDLSKALERVQSARRHPDEQRRGASRLAESDPAAPAVMQDETRETP